MTQINYSKLFVPQLENTNQNYAKILILKIEKVKTKEILFLENLTKEILMTSQK